MIYGEVVTGGDTTRIEWGNDATEWHRQAVREYGAESAKEVEAAFAWRKQLDNMEDQKTAKIIRGVYPE